MASRLIDWVLLHLRLMWAFVGLTFLVMLFIPDARWNVITTVWGALFLGLLISLVLEQRGEGIQRRVWLAQNTDRARTTVEEVLAVAAQSAAFAADLSEEIMQALMSGSTRSARREAAERARAHIWARVAQAQSTPVSADNDHVLGYAEQVREVRERILALRHRHQVVLSRVTQLDLALDRLLDTLRWYEEAVVAKDTLWAEDVRGRREWLPSWNAQMVCGWCRTAVLAHAETNAHASQRGANLRGIRTRRCSVQRRRRTLSPERADDPLDDRVRTGRTNRCGDGTDTDAPSALPDVAPVDRVPIHGADAVA